MFLVNYNHYQKGFTFIHYIILFGVGDEIISYYNTVHHIFNIHLKGRYITNGPIEILWVLYIREQFANCTHFTHSYCPESYIIKIFLPIQIIILSI